MIKDKHCFWDFSKYQGGTNLIEFQHQMARFSHRLPMVSPERVAAEMRSKVESGDVEFTSNSDVAARFLYLVSRLA